MFKLHFFLIWGTPCSFNFPFWSRSSSLFIPCCNTFQCECPSLEQSARTGTVLHKKDLSSGFVTFSSISLAVPFLIDTMDITVCDWSHPINDLLMPLDHKSSLLENLAISNNNLSYLILLARSSIFTGIVLFLHN